MIGEPGRQIGHARLSRPVSGTSGRVGKATLLGLGVGWLIGMLWWVGILVYVSDKATIVNHDAPAWVNWASDNFDKLVTAPVVALPWAVAGAIVGLFTGWLGGYLIPLGAFAGMAAGGTYTLLTSPRDGWLALTVPVYSILGSMLGLLVGGAARILYVVVRGK